MLLLDVAHRVGSAAATSTWLGCANIQAIGRQQLHLSEIALRDLDHQGFAIVQNWVPADDIAALLEDALALEFAAGEARVGTSETRRSDKRIRFSKSLSLHPPPMIAAGRIGARLTLSQRMCALCEQLNAGMAALPMPMVPSATELGYIYYPTGGFYERHFDVPRRRRVASSAGSAASTAASQATTVRTISVLLYLDAGWAAEWGGQLRIHPCPPGEEQQQPGEDGAATGEDGAAPSSPTVDVLPEGGTLVLLRSDRILHEVLPTRRPRHAVVGWMRSPSPASSPHTHPSRSSPLRSSPLRSSPLRSSAAASARPAPMRTAAIRMALEAGGPDEPSGAATQLLSQRCAASLAAGRVHRQPGFTPPQLVTALRHSLRSLAFQPTASYSSNGAEDDLRRALTSRPDVEDPAFDELYERLLYVREELESALGRELSSGIEATFVVYQPGDYYRKHIDSIGGVDPTGSGRRAVSFIVYLPSNDEEWRESDGGALRVFAADDGEPGGGEEDSTEEEDRAGEQRAAAAQPSHGRPAEDVLPEAGLLVLFDSKRVWHEVMPTMRERACLVGWFREV